LRVATETALGFGLALVVAVATPAHAAGSLELIPDPVSLGVNFVVLLLLIYPVNRWLLQPLVAVLQEREARTHGANARAEALVAEAAQARQIIADRTQEARVQAQTSRAALLAEADSEERSVIGEAREDSGRQVESVRESVQAELRAASESLRGDARALAREAAARILGRAL
jgi:F-type H+-transporting ATPase subunit b